jgi:glyoxylase-like metal-dependent hydrolase (beta-lactamase superfamily II)/predicted amino acid-binding ACT domain protein
MEIAMPRKSYITNMPDKAGAFLLASKIIARYNGNIVRVSYNKAVDMHTLFIDVEATTDNLTEIQKELESVGYLNGIDLETRVIVVDIQIPDVSGAVFPVLKILDSYDINISYINSSANGTGYQNFKMGLLIENAKIIKMLLDDISELYQIDIIDYDDIEKNLDNTIFYIRLANEMQKLLGLSTDQTIEFISESNRILQTLQDKGENPEKVFDYIRRFAYFISRHKGDNFKADIEKMEINSAVTLYSIQPPCGSNIYILDTAAETVLVDTGYAIYSDEMFIIFNKLFSDWNRREKKVYITHADVDHCGLLSKLQNAKIYLNKKSADSLDKQHLGIRDYRENNELSLGYSKLSRIISGYTPPSTQNFNIIGSDIPKEHSSLLFIGKFMVANLEFEVFEGSGGHLYGEEIFVCKKYGFVFTGDNVVNINGFSPERAEFNSLAPYLMRSVNVSSKKATEMRNQILNLIKDIEHTNLNPCIICGGHGPLSMLKDNKIVNVQNSQTVAL